MVAAEGQCHVVDLVGHAAKVNLKQDKGSRHYKIGKHEPERELEQKDVRTYVESIKVQ